MEVLDKRCWLVLGSSGLLGHEIMEALSGTGIHVEAPPRSQLDVSDSQQLLEYLETTRPDVIVNSAAWTDVDGAEKDFDTVFRINALSVEVLSEYAFRSGATLVHISTGSVFNGTPSRFFGRGSKPNPINQYNKSKAMAEDYCRAAITRGAKILVVRTYWLYGNAVPNFVDFVAEKARLGESWSVVEDQWGQPTLASDLAEATVWLIRQENIRGFLHATNRGVTSRLEWVRAIYDILGLDDSLVTATRASNFGAQAPRPTACLLRETKLPDGSYLRLRGWDEALKTYLEERYPRETA